MNIFTDGSKFGGKVRAAAVIIKNDIILHQSTFKLHNKCSHNQAEQVANLRALDQIQYLQLAEDTEKIAVVNTDSQVTLDALQKKQTLYTNREIKRLEDLQWTVFFNWVKAHVGIQGNEMANSLAKKAATEDIGEIIFDKIPRETIITEGKEKELAKWQEQWASSTKGAVSKLFFPNIKERMKTRIPISAEFTAMVTGHTLTRSYLHRFKFIPNLTCFCSIKEEQTVNHIILNCTQLENERRFLRSTTV